MQDWQIKLSVVRRHELDARGHGQCERSPNHKLAWIKLMDPIDVEPDDVPYEPEQILAHEFAHVILWAWPKADGMEDTVREQAVECVAHALVAIPPKEGRLT